MKSDGSLGLLTHLRHKTSWVILTQSLSLGDAVKVLSSAQRLFGQEWETGLTKPNPDRATIYTQEEIYTVLSLDDVTLPMKEQVWNLGFFWTCGLP